MPKRRNQKREQVAARAATNGRPFFGLSGRSADATVAPSDGESTDDWNRVVQIDGLRCCGMFSPGHGCVVGRRIREIFPLPALSSSPPHPLANPRRWKPIDGLRKPTPAAFLGNAFYASIFGPAWLRLQVNPLICIEISISTTTTTILPPPTGVSVSSRHKQLKIKKKKKKKKKKEMRWNCYRNRRRGKINTQIIEIW